MQSQTFYHLKRPAEKMIVALSSYKMEQRKIKEVENTNTFSIFSHLWVEFPKVRQDGNTDNIFFLFFNTSQNYKHRHPFLGGCL
jgi:hypothetical protein